MKELTKRKKIIGTIETVLAAAVIIIAVVTAPKLSAQKEEEPSAAASETAAATQAATETEQEKTEPTTSSVGIGVQPIGEYSLNGYIVVTGDAAMEMYSIASTKLKEYAASANNLASKIPSSKVYVMLAPTRMEFYGPEEYRTGSHSQQMGISTAYLALNPEVTGVDAYSEIARHTDEYEYFRTDHHWTARGAYYAYKAFCESAGLPCTPLDSFQSGKLDDFVGSMYRYTQSENLKKNPDYVEYFLPRYDVSAESFSTADMTDGKPLRVISTNITDESSKYLTFIQGDKPLIKMVSSCGSGKKVLLIKESYGNALAPFLLDTFSEVYVLDPRQESIQGMNIPSFVENNGIDTVLFCNYTMVPSNSKYMNALNAMIGA